MCHKNNCTFLFIVLFTSLLGITHVGLCCDVDNDGIADPTSYVQEDDGSWTWRSIKSSDSTLNILNSYGSVNGVPVPAKWYGSTHGDAYAFVDLQTFYWHAYSPVSVDDKLNFGAANVSYLGGGDYNGDGIADLGKFLNRCNAIKKCIKDTSRGNFAFNGLNGGLNQAFIGVTTGTGLFGGAKFPVWYMDADNDGDDDICYAKRRANKCLDNCSAKCREFQAICKDVQTSDQVYSRKLGKIYNRPLSIRRVGAADDFVLWRKVGNTTELSIINSSSGAKTVTVINSLGTVLTAPYLDATEDQIGVANSGTLLVYNPSDDSTTTLSVPSSGTPVSCRNNLNGPGEATLVTTKNSCNFN